MNKHLTSFKKILAGLCMAALALLPVTPLRAQTVNKVTSSSSLEDGIYLITAVAQYSNKFSLFALGEFEDDNGNKPKPHYTGVWVRDGQDKPATVDVPTGAHLVSITAQTGGYYIQDMVTGDYLIYDKNNSNNHLKVSSTPYLWAYTSGKINPTDGSKTLAGAKLDANTYRFSCMAASNANLTLYQLTLTECDAPTLPKVSEVFSNGVYLEWTAPATAPEGYKVEYWPVGCGANDTLTVAAADIDGTECLLSGGLIPGTEYGWRVSSYCGYNNYSAPVNGAVFKTTEEAYAEFSLRSVKFSTVKYTVGEYAYDTTLTVIGNFIEAADGLSLVFKHAAESGFKVTPATATNAQLSAQGGVRLLIKDSLDFGQVKKDTLLAMDGDNVLAKLPFEIALNRPQMPEVVISPETGDYANEVEVSMELAKAVPGVKIYYTLDNSEPTTGSTLYEEPFTIGYVGVTSVKAKAFLEPYAPQATAANTLYDVYEATTYKLVTSIDELFDNDTVIMVSGNAAMSDADYTKSYRTKVDVAVKDNLVELDPSATAPTEIVLQAFDDDFKFYLPQESETNGEDTYLYFDGVTGSTLQTGTTDMPWEVSYDEDGYLTINSGKTTTTGKPYLMGYGYNNQKYKFACFSDGKGRVDFYKKESKQPVAHITPASATLKTLYEAGKDSVTLRVAAKNLGEDLTVTLTARRASAFTISTAALTHVSGKIKNAPVKVVYTWQSEVGKDTAMVVIKSNEVEDTAYIYAESRSTAEKPVEAPVFNPAQNDDTVYRAPITVAISAVTEGSTVKYSRNGTDFADYTAPLAVNGPDTIYAKAVKNLGTSPVVKAVYKFGAAAPVLAPEPKVYADSVRVTITCATEGAKIYYTLDGKTPTASSTLYTGSFKLTQTSTVKAVAILAGWENSLVTEGSYGIHKGEIPEGNIVFYEGFSKINANDWNGSGATGGSNASAADFDESGWKIDGGAMKGVHGIRVNNNSSVTTRSLNLSNDNGRFKLVVNAAAYGSDTKTLTVTAGLGTEAVIKTITDLPSMQGTANTDDGLEEYVLEFDNGSEVTPITFKFAKRGMLGAISIFQDETPSLKLGQDLTMKGIYTGTASEEITLRGGKLESDIAVSTPVNTRGAFSLSPSAFDADEANGSHVLTVTYTARSFASLDTLMIVAVSGELKDTAYVYARTLVCGKPASLEADVDITTATVVINGAGDSVQYQYKAAAAADWSALKTARGREIRLSGLTASTTYLIRVRNICDRTNYSEFDSLEFATLAADAKNVTLLTPAADAVIKSTVTVSFSPRNFKLGEDGSAKISFSGRESVYVTDTAYVAALPSGDYTVTVELVDEDSLSFTPAVKAGPRHFTVQLPKASRPVFAPTESTTVYNDSVRVSITCNTTGAELYYKLDDAAWKAYTGSLLLTDTGSHLLKACAVAPGYSNSDTVSATYRVKTLRSHLPGILLYEENFSKSQVASTNAIAASEFDNYTDMSGWWGQNVFAQVGYVRVGSSKNAGRLTSAGLDLADSNGRYIISFMASKYNAGDESKIKLVAGDSTHILTLAGTDWAEYNYWFANGTESTVFSFEATKASNNRFNLDGIRIYLDTANYSGGEVPVDTSHVEPVDTGHGPVVVVRDTVAMPRIIPNGGVFDDSVSVAFACDTVDADIYYRLDEQDEFVLYTGKLKLYDTCVLEAYAAKEGLENSPVVSAVFYIVKTADTGTSGPGVGFDGSALGLGVNLYPNPTTGKIMVDVAEDALLEVFNVSGLRLYSARMAAGKHELNLRSVVGGSGLYLLRLTAPNNRIAVKRVILK